MIDLPNPEDVEYLSDDEIKSLLGKLLEAQEDDTKQNQLLYYRAASAEAEKIHKSTAGVIGVGGGNRSSKTETCLVEIAALATGIIPKNYAEDLRPKFCGGPINVRICLESHTTVLHPIMLPKLQWWTWTGTPPQGGPLGHWGWIPKSCLVDGDWQKSWSEKLRILTVLCRNPDNFDEILGKSTIQFMSYDQDASDFASGTFHIVLHDEPPPYAIWLENMARTLDVGGRTYLAMTWPEDPSIAVDWIFDEVYEPGSPGPGKSENIDWLELQTLDNIHLDPEKVLQKAENWSEATKSVKLRGQPIRFSNRIHPLFTDVENHWCFQCQKVVNSSPCDCGSVDIVPFCHVKPFEPSGNWPTIWLLDPHPRKPHMFCWAQIDPSDDIWIIAEDQVDGDPTDVFEVVDQVEESLGLSVPLRLIDPNMGRSPASARRGITWQDEFDAAGLHCDLADDSDVGRARLNEYLRPDPYRHQPRFHISERCPMAIQQIKRYAWDEFRRSAERDMKQTPRDKYDDYPTLFKYLMNWEPSFSLLYRGAPVLSRPGTRKGAY